MPNNIYQCISSKLLKMGRFYMLSNRTKVELIMAHINVIILMLLL